MYSSIISAVVGVVSASLLYGLNASNMFWAIFLGALLFLLCIVGISFIFKGKISDLMMQMQKMMVDGQTKIKGRIDQISKRPIGDVKKATAEIENLQKDLLKEVLDFTSCFDQYSKWVPMLAKQINTTRMQLLFQMREFDKVDALMPKCLIMDPMSASMKMARMYVNKEPVKKIEKVFQRATLRAKYNQTVLVYSLMAWIYVKNNNADAALKTLIAADSKNEHPTIKKNRDRLANNKAREFSNAGLGDEWYALLLEQPKVQVKRQQQYQKFGRPF